MCEDPKTERQETTWSPACKRLAKVVKTAAIPVAVAHPASAPSIRATLSMNSVVVGFENLE